MSDASKLSLERDNRLRLPKWLIVALTISILAIPVALRILTPAMERRKVVEIVRRRDWKALVDRFSAEDWKKSGMDKGAVIKFLDRYFTEEIVASRPPIAKDMLDLDGTYQVVLRDEDGIIDISFLAQEVEPLFPRTGVPLIGRIPGRTKWYMDIRTIADDFALVTSPLQSKYNDLTFYEFLLQERKHLKNLGMVRFELIGGLDWREPGADGYLVGTLEPGPPQTIEYLLRQIEEQDKGKDPDISKVAKRFGRNISR